MLRRHVCAAQLKSKAGEVADVNGGALLKELQDSKNKAPYVQPGPVRATPDILNLDEPGKVIREVREIITIVCWRPGVDLSRHPVRAETVASS